MNQNNIVSFIESLLEKLRIPFDSVECEENNGQTIYQIHTSESGLVIGTRGETVRALNHIVKKAFERDGETVRFLIDVNEYRMKKIRELEQSAKILAERARTLKYNVEMKPMSAYERMVVHSALADEQDIRTESHGEGRDRRVVICFVEQE